MCLTIVAEPIEHKNADELKTGTWFTDPEGQIYVLIRDDRNNETRILCAGGYYDPFILNIPTDKIKVSKILDAGTILKIITPFVEGGQNEFK